MVHRRKMLAAALTSSLALAGLSLGVSAHANPGDPPGTIRTIAGVTKNFSTGGFSGDGGPAIQAQLYDPRAITWGPAGSGDMYFTDSLNERIRKIDGTGNISTVAGSPQLDPNGNALPCVYPAGATPACGDGGKATAAGFNQPHGIAFDSAGNMYISDSQNHRIRKVDAATGNISTFAGTGDPHTAHGDGGPASAAGIKDPKQMMVVNDVLYFCDTGHNMVQSIDLKTNILKTIAGTVQAKHWGGDGGPANQASLFQPKGMFVAPDGTIYISDSDNNLIRKVTTDGIIHTIAGDTAAAAANPTSTNPLPGDSAGDGGPAVNAHVNGPRGIIVDSAGNIYFAETLGARIRRIDPNGIISTIAGDGQTRHDTSGHGVVPGDPGPTPALQAEFDWPHDLLLDPTGNLILADQKDDRIRMITDAANAPGGNVNGAPPGSGAPGPGGGVVNPPAPGQSGYWMLGNDGKVYGFGNAKAMGDPSANLPAGAKAVHIEPTPDYQGYWVVDDAGHVYAYGDAKALGNLPSVAANEKVTSLSATPSGQGYWIFTSLGRVATFGDAQSFGDMSKTRLNGAVQSSIPTPSGKGYFMVASDGGVFAFGDAKFIGSMGSTHLNQPVESLVPTRDGQGYWLVASDGGIFAFGTAPFKGSMGSTRLNKPVVGMVRYGDGYLMVGADGGIFDFSNKPFVGSLGSNPPAHPIVFAATLDT